jgi:hypothetical protein
MYTKVFGAEDSDRVLNASLTVSVVCLKDGLITHIFHNGFNVYHQLLGGRLLQAVTSLST